MIAAGNFFPFFLHSGSRILYNLTELPLQRDFDDSDRRPPQVSKGADWNSRTDAGARARFVQNVSGHGMRKRVPKPKNLFSK
jgi:hypothetical protein